MKKLIICNTYFQLLAALQMKLTLFEDCTVDLFLSDHCMASQKVVTKLAALSIFRNVRYIKTKRETYNLTKTQKFNFLLQLNFGQIVDVDIDYYDEIIFYSASLYLYRVADYYTKVKHVAKWSRFEEGIFSYETDNVYGGIIKSSRKIRRYTFRLDILKTVSNYYCFFPELKDDNCNLNLIKIPSISQTKASFLNIANFIFDYQEVKIKQKYIFFASSSDIDGHPFGETEKVLQIADQVGKEELLIKMHPRDNRNVYEERGIAVIRNSFIPWEVFHLNNDFTDKELLTIHSGSFISISAILNDNTSGVFLYPKFSEMDMIFNERSSDINIMLKKLHALQLCMNIKSSETIRESEELRGKH